MKPLRILLVDDHSLVRTGIRTVLSHLPDVAVVGEAQNGREALQMLEELSPYLVFMDISMPGLNGFEAARRIRQRYPEVRIVFLSMFANMEYVRQAVRSGADGYIIKSSAGDELELAVETVRKGRLYFSPSISEKIQGNLKKWLNEPEDALESLSPRQRETLQLIAEGKRPGEIASAMGIGIKTVESFRLQLMKRLDIRDVPGLVRFAIRKGLIQPDE